MFNNYTQLYLQKIVFTKLGKKSGTNFGSFREISRNLGKNRGIR